MSSDKSYSSDDLREIINVATLTAKMANIDAKFDSLCDKVKSASETSLTFGDKLDDAVKELRDRIDNSHNDLHACRSDVEDTLKTAYVTNEQLKIALMEMKTSITESITKSNEAIRKEFKEYGDKVNAQVKENTDMLTKYRNYGAAFVSVAVAISWILGVYLNASKVASSEKVAVSNSEVQHLLKDMKRQQDEITRQHELLMKDSYGR